MNSPETPGSTFAPLPLRARGPMEVLDVAVRVYKQYFWTLIAWSAFVAIGRTVLSLLPGVSIISVLLSPLVTGACVCCIAAAVRGMAVDFKQCGAFSRSRYGAMLGMYLLSGLVAVGVVAAGSLFVFAVAWLLSTLGDSKASVVLMIILACIGIVLAILLGSCIAIWINLVQVVVCMEEEHRGVSALRRTYDLLSGHWIRVSGLITLLGLGMLALLAIFCAAGALLVGMGSLRDLFKGTSTDGAMWGLIGVWGASMVAIWIAWTPIFYLTLTLFYLDLRIRKEALDLEWTAHTTTPPEAQMSATPGIWSNESAAGFGGASGFAPLPSETPAARSDSWYDALPATPTVPLPAVHRTAVDLTAPRIICTHCGASVVQAETCSNCGARLPVPSLPAETPTGMGTAGDNAPPFQP